MLPIKSEDLPGLSAAQRLRPTNASTQTAKSAAPIVALLLVAGDAWLSILGISAIEQSST